MAVSVWYLKLSTRGTLPLGAEDANCQIALSATNTAPESLSRYVDTKLTAQFLKDLRLVPFRLGQW